MNESVKRLRKIAKLFFGAWLLLAMTGLAVSAESSSEAANPTAVAATEPASANALIAPSTVAATNDVLAQDELSHTNTVSKLAPAKEELAGTYVRQLEMARYLQKTGSPSKAEPILKELLAAGTPELIQQSALLELGNAVQAQNDYLRAQSIYTQFLTRWPNDSRAPELLLKQGQNFRMMGLNSLAMVKFYAVMTAALALKNDQLNYYQHLVLQAQTEIAETHYQMGKFADAADYFGRLLKQNDPELNRPQTQFRLIRSLAATGRYEETAHEAQDFLSRYNEAPQQPEVRFYLSQALKQVGRNSDALQQVLQLLQEQKVKTQDKPEVWAYWQQRAGNEIANQLYHDGDYPRALAIYLNLAQLDSSPSWQLPVYYQIGITYERLLQPAKATEIYNKILGRETELGTNASPGMKAVIDMARWRIGFLDWQIKAEATAKTIPGTVFTSANTNTNAADGVITQ